MRYIIVLSLLLSGCAYIESGQTKDGKEYIKAYGFNTKGKIGDKEIDAGIWPSDILSLNALKE